MLINSTRLKRRLMKNINDKIKFETLRKSDLVRGIRRHFQFEGNQMGVSRPDGTVSISEIKKIEASSIVQREQAATPGSIGNMIDDLSSQLADSQSKMILESMNEAVEAVGNTVSGNGGGITPEVILKMLEKIQMDFDGDLPKYPSIVVGPGQEELFKHAIAEMMTQEPYKTKHEEIMKNKKREFDEREASRKLVD